MSLDIQPQIRKPEWSTTNAREKEMRHTNIHSKIKYSILSLTFYENVFSSLSQLKIYPIMGIGM